MIFIALKVLRNQCKLWIIKHIWTPCLILKAWKTNPVVSLFARFRYFQKGCSSSPTTALRLYQRGKIIYYFVCTVLHSCNKKSETFGRVLGSSKCLSMNKTVSKRFAQYSMSRKHKNLKLSMSPRAALGLEKWHSIFLSRMLRQVAPNLKLNGKVSKWSSDF